MSKEQWVSYLDSHSKAAALSEYPTSKQIFVDSIRASSTCPYISSVIPDDDPRKALLDEKGYYITPYQPGDDPTHHAKISTPRQKKMLRFNGWTDQEFNLVPIEYKTNKNGFRDIHFSDEPGVACFGCSNTFGTGLKAEQTWPSRLQEKINQKTWNLGTPALSLEPITWYALQWMDEDLPNLTGIVVFVPPGGRAMKVSYSPDRKLFVMGRWKDLLNRDNLNIDAKEAILDNIAATSQITNEVSLKTLELIAKIKNVPFVSIRTDEVLANDWARDMQHRGPQTMDRLADQIKARLFNR